MDLSYEVSERALVPSGSEKIHCLDQIGRVFHLAREDWLTGISDGLAQEPLVEIALAFARVRWTGIAENFVDRLRISEAPALDVRLGAADRVSREQLSIDRPYELTPAFGPAPAICVDD